MDIGVLDKATNDALKQLTDLGLIQPVGDDVLLVQPGCGCHLCCE